MKGRLLISLLLINIAFGLGQAQSKAISELLRTYTNQGATAGNAEQGELLWQKKFSAAGEFSSRSCTSCHTKDLTQSGNHIKTNKTIEPMSPSVNSQRLTDIKKIEKWFKRNCKWTIGRECTSQEKTNILTYIENETRF